MKRPFVLDAQSAFRFISGSFVRPGSECLPPGWRRSPASNAPYMADAAGRGPTQLVGITGTSFGGAGLRRDGDFGPISAQKDSERKEEKNRRFGLHVLLILLTLVLA
jgi:hypothetical protein